MKTEKQLNADILKITMKIEDLFPELSKYIGEILITSSVLDSPNSNIKELKEYYNSLDQFIREYANFSPGSMFSSCGIEK